MTLMSRILLLAGLTILFRGASFAQVTTGLPPLGTFDTSSGPDAIDLANLNAHITIPVLHKSGRGLNFLYDLSHDTSVWYRATSGSTKSWQPVYNWGWRAQTETATGYVSVSGPVIVTGGPCYHWVGTYIYHDPVGAPHQFGGTVDRYYGDAKYGCRQAVVNNTRPTIDGSGYTLALKYSYLSDFGTVYSRYGQAINVPQPFGSGVGSANSTDRNGNEITTDGNGNYYDTLSSTPPVLAVSGSGTSTSPMKYTYTAPSGAPASYTVNYTNYTVATNFGLSGTSEYKSSAAVPLVSSIVLPDGSQYLLQYEPTPSTPASGACTPYAGTTCVTARLQSITLPTGGSIVYSYSGVDNRVFPDGSAAGLTRTLSDGAGWSATWTYTRTAGSGATSATLITAPKLPYDPAANQTIIQFQGFFQTQRNVYQGAAPTITSLPIPESSLLTSNLLHEVQTCYNGSAMPCTGTAVATPINRRTVNSQVPGQGMGVLQNYFYNTYGQLTEEDDYDFGKGTPWVLLRKKVITIQTVGTYQAIQTAQVFDGNNNLLKQTQMTFDQGSVTPTGAPQHQNPTVGRGNPTTISSLVQGSTSLTKTLTYFDTGNVQTGTDVNNGVTTYDYSTGNTCGSSFPTKIIEPITALTQYFTWNCTGGVATSVQDENQNSVSTTYSDAYFWRPAYTKDQLGNETNFTYNGQTSVESSLNFNGTTSTSDTLVTLDGLGRPHISQTKQGQTSSSHDSVETDYDALGRPNRATIPYSGTAGQTCSSCLATTTTYDALGRVMTVTDPGNGTITYTYTQNDVYQALGPAPTGENTKRSQSEYDGLGRLTSVCEITGATGSGSCGQNSAQTGYWAKYAYDANGNLTGVTQNAQSTGSQQTRSYGYDGLSRMTTETNPESGTTTYAYDAPTATCTNSAWNGDMPGTLVQTQDASGNVTCYYHDALGRIVTKEVQAGPGAWANSGCNRYYYDNSSGLLGSRPSGVTVNNGLGRLVEADTDNCSWPPTQSSIITDEWFSYTARGETSDLWESTLHSGGYLHTQASYWANGAVNSLQMIGGNNYGNIYNLDGEGRFYSTSNGNLTSTSYNTASQPTQINYGSGDSDRFTYDPSGRMNKYQYNVGSQSVVGIPTWNANGTLGSLVITDPFNSLNAQTCNYSHDDLLRIASANCGSIWAQTFTYDAFGNINKSGNSSFGATYSSATNRMTQIGSSTPTYDADGNVTNDFLHTYAWDGYGRPVTIDGIGITYDAMGRMVEQNRSGTYTQIEYAPTGLRMQLITGGINGSYVGFVPLPGGAEAVWAGGSPHYRHPDWLGSARLTTTSSRTVMGDAAYAPFGETYAASGTPDLSFTGINQDTTGNEYDFPARQYGIQGRWPSPDPLGLGAVNPGDPQTWNRYAYAGNNPLAATDPTGAFAVVVPPGPDPITDIIGGIIDILSSLFGLFGGGPPPPQALPAPQGGYGSGYDPFSGSNCPTDTCIVVTATPPGTYDLTPYFSFYSLVYELSDLSHAWFVPSAYSPGEPPLVTDEMKLRMLKVAGMEASHDLGCAASGVAGQIPFAGHLFGGSAVGQAASTIDETGIVASQSGEIARGLSGYATTMREMGATVSDVRPLALTAGQIAKYGPAVAKTAGLFSKFTLVTGVAATAWDFNECVNSGGR